MTGLITRNLPWKLLSLLMSVLLWLVFVGDRELTTTIAVSVQFKNAPEGIDISSDAPERISLELRGPSARLSDFDNIRAPVIIDLSDVTGPGERTFNITRSNVSLPAGIELVRAMPSQIRLRFERFVSREIPIRVFTTGSLPTGFRIVNQTVSPQVARVVGTESRVSAILAAETDPVDISGLVETREFRVNIFVDDPRVRLESPDQVTVKIVIAAGED